MITHTRKGCKCMGDGVHGAPSDAPEEPEADTSPSIRANKKQRLDSGASSGEPIHNDDEPMQPAPPSSCKSFYLHEILLYSSCQYFRTILETRAGVRGTEMSTVGKPRTITIIQDYYEEAEMEAVELVLKSFYAMGEPPLDTLPSEIDAKVPLLLKALMVAERYQADRSKEKIAKVLSSIPASDLSFEIVRHAVQLRGYQEEFPSLSGFKTSVSDVLFEKFGDVPLILETEHLWENIMTEFLELPFHAFLALIKRDDLKVHSENDVACLLFLWIEEFAMQPDRIKPSPDEIDDLIKEIKVVNLGPAYFHFLLPRHAWLCKSRLWKLCPYVAIVRESRAIENGNEIGRQLERIRKLVPDLPPSWLSAPRKASGYIPPASVVFTWMLNEKQLKELYDGKRVSQDYYHNGHWIKVLVCEWQARNEGGGAPAARSLFLGAAVDSMVMHTGLDCFVVLISTASIDKVGDAPEKKRRTANWILRSEPSGYSDFLGRKCPTIQEVVAPYLVDGKLTIKFEVNKVDEAPVRIPSEVPASPHPAGALLDLD